MDGRVDEDGVDELVDAHVLQHLLLVLLAHIVAVLHTSTAFEMRRTTLPEVDALASAMTHAPHPDRYPLDRWCSLHGSQVGRCLACQSLDSRAPWQSPDSVLRGRRRPVR